VHTPVDSMPVTHRAPFEKEQQLPFSLHGSPALPEEHVPPGLVEAYGEPQATTRTAAASVKVRMRSTSASPGPPQPPGKRTSQG
jgi:hypothetical protein